MQMSYSYASHLPFKNFCKLAKQAETIKNRFWLWLSIVWLTRKLTLYQPGVKSFLLHNFSLQNTRKSLHFSASKYYSFTARNQGNFRPWKLTLSLTRSMKVHRRALFPYCLPSLWKIRKRILQFSIFDPATWQHPREKPRHVRGYMTSGWHNLF